jgi:hypothetical protein
LFGFSCAVIGSLAGLPFGMLGIYVGPVVALVLGMSASAYGRRLSGGVGERARKATRQRAVVGATIEHFADRLSASRAEDARLIVDGGVPEVALELVMDDIADAGRYTSADLDVLVDAARQVAMTPGLRSGLTKLGAPPPP